MAPGLPSSGAKSNPIAGEMVVIHDPCGCMPIARHPKNIVVITFLDANDNCGNQAGLFNNSCACAVPRN